MIWRGVVAFCCFVAGGAYADCSSDLIDGYYRGNDGTELRAHLDQLTDGAELGDARDYLIAYGSYRLAELHLAADDKDAAKKSLDTGIKLLEENEDVESLALLSMLYGMKAGLSGFKAMFIGPKASGAVEKALEIDAEHPRALIADGVRLFHAPGAFGGDKKKTAEVLAGATQIFAAGGGMDGEICWGADTALLYQGLSYASSDDPERAAAAFNSVLERHPDHFLARWRLAQLEN